MALAFAMALHELATNALKYGALSNDTGQIHLSWGVGHSGERRLWLRWRETGGPQVKPREKRGFGSRLIERSLALDLDGHASLDFESTGVVCSIEAPLPPTGTGISHDRGDGHLSGEEAQKDVARVMGERRNA
jgi:two-component sensor histidine kinase